METSAISRRQFLGDIAKGTLLALVGAPLLAAGEPAAQPPSPDLRTVSLDDKAFGALKTVGGSAILPLSTDQKPLILWRQTDTVLKAFSSECTHTGCQLRLPRNGKMKCPCHFSEFDENGKPIKGPAKKALKEYAVQLLKDSMATVDLRAPIS
jgi:Rieske Fe-S protein